MTTPDAIVGNGRVLSSTYVWEIDNYSLYSSLETGKYICSPSFNALGNLWYLKLRPNGDTEEHKEYICLFLNMIEDSPVIGGIQAQFAFSCLDSEKKVLATKNSYQVYTFSKQKCWGVHTFMKNSLLKNNANINTTKKIIILCELIIKEAKLYKTTLTANPERIQHFKEFRNQLNNQKFSDIKLKVQNQEIHAHKMVLAANSKVFAAMFEHKMRENEENIVKIEDVSYKVVNELLRFLYSGECTLSEDIVSELFEAADKYQVLKLKEMCEEELCRNINVDNMVAFLQLADMHSAERLKKETIDFIALHGKEIIDNPQFESIGSLNSKLLLDVFRGVFASKN